MCGCGCGRGRDALRARKRSSERMAMLLTRRMETARREGGLVLGDWTGERVGGLGLVFGCTLEEAAEVEEEGGHFRWFAGREVPGVDCV